MAGKKKSKNGEGEYELLKKELEDCEDTNLRLKADFENYRKQLDRDKEQFAGLAGEDIIVELLGVVDDLERAAERGEEGIGLIHKNFLKVLENSGLRRIKCIGKKFDPHYHEVMMQEDSEEEEGTIIEELQVGYMLKDKVIRHSKVKIANEVK